jgi:hypothetical protein
MADKCTDKCLITKGTHDAMTLSYAKKIQASAVLLKHGPSAKSTDYCILMTDRQVMDTYLQFCGMTGATIDTISKALESLAEDPPNIASAVNKLKLTREGLISAAAQTVAPLISPVADLAPEVKAAIDAKKPTDDAVQVKGNGTEH